MAGAKVTIPLTKFNENQNYIGETNGTIDSTKHELKVLANLSVAGVHSRQISKDGTNMEFEDIQQSGVFTRLAVGAVMLQGGTVENYPMWVNLTTSQLNSSVPAGFPGRSYTNDSDVVVIRTWQQWADNYGRAVQDLTNGTKAIELSDGKKYFGSTEFLILAGASLPYLDTNEVKALLPTEE